MIKVDCKGYADRLLESVKEQVLNSDFQKDLVIFSAGSNPASAAYMKGKMKDCDLCGVGCSIIRTENQCDLLMKIQLANAVDKIGGMIVQLPLPEGFDEQSAVEAVSSKKDVDGFKSDSPFTPCTPEGIMYVLTQELGDLTGLNALVVGRGKLVGEPIAKMLLDANCTVTIAHSKTKPEALDELLAHNDIIIVAAGKPNLIDLKKCNARIVIDVGVNRDENGKLCGDCFNFDPDDGSAMRVTTVPGGVGLMTRAMLMKHMGEIHS